MARAWFFLVLLNSSSFSATRLSISCLTWASSSCVRSTLFSSISKVMVIKGKVDKNAFSEAFKAKGIERSKDVETFLANMTGDQEGIIHLFNWSALIDEDKDLGQVLQVPNLETGKFEPLITGDVNGALTADEEMQFRNMVHRLHKIFKYAKEQNVRVMA